MPTSITKSIGPSCLHSRQLNVSRRACPKSQQSQSKETDHALLRIMSRHSSKSRHVCLAEIPGPQSVGQPPLPTPPATSDPLQGQVSLELVQRMRESITEALQAESVSIVDTYGDGRHVSIDVVSSQFEGKSSVKRQQAVYKAIWLELQETVHAVDAMTTKTPAEAAS